MCSPTAEGACAFGGRSTPISGRAERRPWLLPWVGIKVTSDHGWFAARPSGTEDVYKIYAESFRSEAHLKQIQNEAQSAIAQAFKG